MADRICPPDHKHQSTCYTTHSCRCPECRKYVADLARQRYREKAYGTYEHMTDSRGTVRRIEGLQLLGWRSEEIICVSGLARIDRFSLRAPVSVETAERIRQATYELLKLGEGPSRVTAARARRAGFVSLLAWNDIDNDASPEKTERERSRHGVDEVAVEQAMNGYGGERLNTAEADEAIERLHARQWSDALIGATIRRSEKTVLLTRQRLGLEAWPTADLVKRRAA